MYLTLKMQFIQYENYIMRWTNWKTNYGTIKEIYSLVKCTASFKLKIKQHHFYKNKLLDIDSNWNTTQSKVK